MFRPISYLCLFATVCLYHVGSSHPPATGTHHGLAMHLLYQEVVSLEMIQDDSDDEENVKEQPEHNKVTYPSEYNGQNHPRCYCCMEWE